MEVSMEDQQKAESILKAVESRYRLKQNSLQSPPLSHKVVGNAKKEAIYLLYISLKSSHAVSRILKTQKSRVLQVVREMSEKGPELKKKYEMVM